MKKHISNFHLGHISRALCVAAIGLSFVFSSVVAQAQDSGTENYDYGAYVGSKLPSGIKGVREIMPLFGGRFALNRTFGAIEFGLQNSHAHGADFASLNANVRGEIPFADGMSVFIYGGPNLHYFRPKNKDDWKMQGGIHIGAAGVVHISGAVSVRADITLNNSPGATLDLTFGVMFR